jgi:ribosomal protein S18 acetylase RimI-like enzyme
LAILKHLFDMKTCAVVPLETPCMPALPAEGDALRRGLVLRASAPDDRNFLQQVFIGTRAPEFAAAGLDADAIHGLLVQQFTMQDEYYRRHYPKGRFDVVLDGACRIGRLYHDWHSGEARIIDIALLPEYRGAGIGTRLMKTIVAEAARRALAVSLYVELDNPVRGFYRRLGFEAIGEDGVYERMRRKAAPFHDREFEPAAGLTEAVAA